MDNPSVPLPPCDVVTALLGVHGIVVPDDDVAAIAELYPGLRRRMERIHAVECGDGS